MKLIGWAIVTMGSIILLLAGILYLRTDRCEVAVTKVAHYRYAFNLPMSFSKAIQYFDLDSVSRRTALRYDERGWLKVKVVQNYRDQSSNDSEEILISGVNFYFNDSLSRKWPLESHLARNPSPSPLDAIVIFPNLAFS